MFILYKSHSFSKLIKKIYTIIIENPLDNPLTEEIFVVSNSEIAQWIKIFIAQNFEISANIKFIKSYNFIWTIVTSIIPLDISKIIMDQYSLLWKIANTNEIKKIIFEIPTIDKNLTEESLFNIILLLSNLLESYINYRPNWITNWSDQLYIFKKNLSEHWQQKLWIKLIKNINDNNQSILNILNLLLILKKAIKNKNYKKNVIPNRIFICELIYLNPINIMLLKEISKICTIYLLCITPYNIEEKKLFSNLSLQKKNIQTEKKILNFYKYIKKLLHLHNKLISNFKNDMVLHWSNYDFEYILLLTLIDKKEVIIHNKNKKSNLLEKLQKKIISSCCNINHKNKNNTKPKKQIINQKDKSISIHVCRTLKVEIEILHKTLLKLLHKNKNIEFQDILIISTNLNDYLPYIHTIFNTINKNYNIPFIINPKFNNHTILEKIIKKILNLPNLELNKQTLIKFLEIPQILKIANIKTSETTILKEIITNSEIQWEQDDFITKNTFLKTKKYWKSGIQRVLLGIAITDQDHKSWNNIVPYSNFDPTYIKIFNKFITLLLFLKKWKKILSQLKFLPYWNTVFKKLVNKIFTYSEQQTTELKFIIQKFKKIINSGIKENYKKRISIIILKNLLFDKQKHHSTKKYQLFSKNVIFCNNFSLCNIPFKIIYILGMNEKFNTNSNSIKNTYDLIFHHPSLCDFNKKNKYQSLLLNTLLSAKQYFYISYALTNEHTLKAYSSSHYIKELCSYIHKNFYLKIKKNTKNNKNNDGIKSHIYSFYLDEERFQKTNMFLLKHYYHSNSQLSVNCNNNKKNINQFIKTITPVKDTNINIIKLISFWKNPIKQFFNVGLNLKLYPIYNETINLNELNITNWNNYKINCNLLKYLLNKKNTHELLKYYQYLGIIPNSTIGEIFWDKKYKLVECLYLKIKKIHKNLYEKKFTLTINNFTIHGLLKNIVYNSGILRWKPNPINFQDIITLWFEHLIYCSLYQEKNSILLGIKNSSITFIKIEKQTAIKLLTKYSYGYFKGMKKPIILTRSGISWLNSIFDKVNKIINTNDDAINITSRQKLLKTWLGDFWHQGEKNNLYIQKIITKLNEEEIKNLCAVAEKWILPIFKYILKIRHI